MNTKEAIEEMIRKKHAMEGNILDFVVRQSAMFESETGCSVENVNINVQETTALRSSKRSFIATGVQIKVHTGL